MNEYERNNQDKLSLIGILRAFRRSWKVVALFTVLSVVITGVVSLFMPDKYKSSTLLVPVSSSGGKSSMMSDMSSMGFGNLVTALGSFGSGSSDIGRMGIILNSRTVAERVVEQTDILPQLFPKKWDLIKGRWKVSDPDKIPTALSGVGRLKKYHTKLDVNKRERKIKIEAFFKDPDTAARVANAYADALQWFINENALTTAKRNRIYIGEQLQNQKLALLEQGREMKGLYKEGKVSSVESDFDVVVEELPQGSDGIDIKLASLMKENEQLNGKISAAKVVKDVPQQIYLSYVMMQNQIRAKINSLLATQYEMAKIQEKKEELAFQVVDKAIPSKGKYSPRPKFMCMAAFIMSLMACALFIVLKERYMIEKNKGTWGKRA